MQVFPRRANYEIMIWSTLIIDDHNTRIVKDLFKTISLTKKRIINYPRSRRLKKAVLNMRSAWERTKSETQTLSLFQKIAKCSRKIAKLHWINLTHGCKERCHHGWLKSYLSLSPASEMPHLSSAFFREWNSFFTWMKNNFFSKSDKNWNT